MVEAAVAEGRTVRRAWSSLRSRMRPSGRCSTRGRQMAEPPAENRSVPAPGLTWSSAPTAGARGTLRTAGPRVMQSTAISHPGSDDRRPPEAEAQQPVDGRGSMDGRRGLRAGARTEGFSVRKGTATRRPSRSSRPITLTRRGRLLLVGLPIALGVSALIVVGAFLTSQAHAGSTAPATIEIAEVDVMAGETLWDLATTYAPDRDPRDVVSEMVELNDLHTSVLRPGQHLVIPLQD